MYSLYVGIAIAADQAHIDWQQPTSQQTGQCVIAQTESAYQQLARQLLTVCPEPQQSLLVMEASANDWLTLALFLHERCFAVSVLNPLQGKRFAQMQLRRAKTDPMDARLLSDFAYRVQPKRWTPPPSLC